MSNAIAAVTLIARPQIATVLVDEQDSAALIAWVDAIGKADVQVIPIANWCDVVSPKELPTGGIHIIANTRRDKETWEHIKAFCLALSQSGRNPLLTETTISLQGILSEDMSWENLTRDAVAKPAGRAPAAPPRPTRTDVGVHSLPSLGITSRKVEWTAPDGSPQHDYETVVGWAAWLVATRHIDGKVFGTIGVRFPLEGGGYHQAAIENVDLASLSKFEWLLASRSTYKLSRPPRKDEVDVANAIMAALGPNGEDTEEREGQSQMGWTDRTGRATFIKSDAGINSDGVDPTVFGTNSEAAEPYAYGAEKSIEDERAALHAVLVDMPALMVDPAAWVAALGQFGRAMTPGAPGCALTYYGLTNHGKTFIGRCAASLMGNGLLTGKLTNANATKVGLEQTAAMHATGVFLIDDVPPITDPSDLKRVRDILDEVLRAAHEEGSLKIRGAIVNGGVGLAKTPDAHPSAIITTEENVMQLMPRASIRNRGLAVEIVLGKEFESKNESDAFRDLCRLHAPNAGYAYTRWRAGEIDRAGGVTASEEAAAATIKNLERAVKEAHPNWATRVHEVYAAFLFGWSQVVKAAHDIGAISDHEKAQAEETGADAIERLFDVFVNRWLSQADGNQIVSDIWVHLRASQACIGEACKHGASAGSRCGEGCGQIRPIGKRHGETVALSPADVAKLLSTPSRPFTEDMVRKQLLDIEGAKTVRLRLCGQRLYLVTIPDDAFYGVGETDEVASE